MRCVYPVKRVVHLAASILVGLALIAPSAQSAKRRAAPVTAAKKETELKAVQERIERVSRSIQADAEKRDSLTAELKTSDESIQDAREALAAVRSQRQAAEAQLNSLLADKRDTEKQIDAQRAALAAELRLAYVEGREEQLKILLNQQDPSALGRMMGYYGYFSRARSERITAISDRLAHLSLVTEGITQQTEQLRDLEAQHARGVAALAQARDRRAATLKRVEANLQNDSQRLAKLRADAAALAQLVEELRQAALARARESGRESHPVVGHGQWQWPLKGEVLAKFGQSRGGTIKWEGMLISAPQGTPVHAPAGGRVLYSDWLPGLGLLLVLDHGNGVMSLYGHNEQLFKKQGETVATGDVLAAVGVSSLGGRSGLYLEVRNGKQAVDPLRWLGRD